MRPAKTLAEHYRDGTFKRSRHGHLLTKHALDDADLMLVLDRAEVGFEDWQSAALIGCPVHVVTNALLVHAHRKRP